MTALMMLHTLRTVLITTSWLNICIFLLRVSGRSHLKHSWQWISPIQEQRHKCHWHIGNLPETPFVNLPNIIWKSLISNKFWLFFLINLGVCLLIMQVFMEEFSHAECMTVCQQNLISFSLKNYLAVSYSSNLFFFLYLQWPKYSIIQTCFIQYIFSLFYCIFIFNICLILLVLCFCSFSHLFKMVIFMLSFWNTSISSVLNIYNIYLFTYKTQSELQLNGLKQGLEVNSFRG